MKQTHKSLISALALAGLLTPALVLNGCDGGGGSAPAATAQAAKANVGISVEFPAPGASAARIDDNATAIRVDVWDATNVNCESITCFGDPTRSVTLDRPAGGGTVSANLLGVSPGEALVRVTQLSGSGDTETILETVNVAANLIEGQNSMTVTLLRAAWTLQTPITFNKIVSSDTSRVDSFALVPSQTFSQAQSAATGNVDVYGQLTAAVSPVEIFARGFTTYGAVLRGANLCSQDFDAYGGYGGTITCGQTQLVSQRDEIGYFNRHDSNDSANGFASLVLQNDMPLANDSQGRGRGWMALSLGADGLLAGVGNTGPGADEVISDPAVLNDFKFEVTGGSTVAGNIIEWRDVSTTSANRRCFSDQLLTTAVTCPAAAVPTKAGAKGKAYRQALIKALAAAKAGPAKSAADAQGCYLNLQAQFTDIVDITFNPNTLSNIYVVEDVTDVVDVCRHPFTATATQLPSTDVDLVVNGSPVPVNASVRR